MTCTVYKFIEPMQVYISQYGVKGGCFIDGCYAMEEGIENAR